VEELGADELGAGESPAADAAATGAAAAGGEAATHETDTCEANTGEDVEPSEPVEEEEPTEKKAEEPESTQSSEQTVEDPDEKFKPHPEQDAKSAANTAERRYKPAFEPGSVFDRLSRGEFNRKEEVVEAGGFTSEEAKLSRDFDQQFEIARQPKLLPYLAMNSGLYEDLYAWLEALGNEDIDAALKTNPGYRTWKEQGE
ncbi:MAG: FHA domain-containing protein, partial [Parascardovia denticolens]